ncbi:MAG: hypothetical protein P8M68_01475 [Aquiluna sp.]|nr:hypothetical protein [Aquiluna sp.]
MTKQLAGSLWDSRQFGLLTAIVSALPTMQPLRPLTLMVGCKLNVTSWPQNRPYLSILKLLSGDTLLQLGHKSEVKIIKTTSRHDIPSTSGWAEPQHVQGISALGWNKTIPSGTTEVQLLNTLKHALDDIVLTYALHEPGYQIIWLLPDDLGLLRELDEDNGALGATKGFMILSASSLDSLPSLSGLVQDGELGDTRFSMGPSGNPRPPGDLTPYAVANHRGRPLALLLVAEDAFGVVTEVRAWNGSHFMASDALMQSFCRGTSTFTALDTSLACQFWNLTPQQLPN